MAREIKFRAWINGEMTFEGFHVAAPGHFWVWEYPMESKILEGEVMQFTGLKDKNGVEVYEGDVLKLRRESDSLFYRDVYVYYDSENAIYRVKSCNSQFVDLTFLAHTISFRTIEVIGNIYQNPELLTT